MKANFTLVLFVAYIAGSIFFLRWGFDRFVNGIPLASAGSSLTASFPAVYEGTREGSVTISEGTLEILIANSGSFKNVDAAISRDDVNLSITPQKGPNLSLVAIPEADHGALKFKTKGLKIGGIGLPPFVNGSVSAVLSNFAGEINQKLAVSSVTMGSHEFVVAGNPK